jgi:RNA polymerase sigma-70 factor (ECF subfamily)
MASRPLPAPEAPWLDRFHAGDRAILDECYRNHFRVVESAVGQVLRGADKETVIHDVFLQLLARADLRHGFTGGSFTAWLATIARHQAIDFWRRYRREHSLEQLVSRDVSAEPVQPVEPIERTVEARLLVDRFRREVLPAKWACVFEARFVSGLDQRSAAAQAGISRTTLAYQEIQIRRLLRRFLFGRGKR